MLCFFMLIEDEAERGKLERLYYEYRERMLYVAFSVLKDKQEAENMVHDTFLALMDHLDQIDEAECHRTWNYIVTILKHKCFNRQKRQKRIDYLDEDGSEPADLFDMTERLEKQEVAEVLAEEIQKLKYPYKEVLYLYYYNEMKSKEIGQLLGLSAENVRQIMKRAKDRLKKRLLERGYRD